MTAYDKYSVHNSESLLQLIHMQLSKNVKAFSQHFAPFLESTSNFKHFEKKYDPRSLCIFEVTDCEKHG